MTAFSDEAGRDLQPRAGDFGRVQPPQRSITELQFAWEEARRAITEGDALETTAEEHIARLQRELAENAI